MRIKILRLPTSKNNGGELIVASCSNTHVCTIIEFYEKRSSIDLTFVKIYFKNEVLGIVASKSNIFLRNARNRRARIRSGERPEACNQCLESQVKYGSGDKFQWQMLTKIWNFLLTHYTPLTSNFLGVKISFLSL